MFDGNGNWTSDFSAVSDRDNNIKILASRFDNIFIADIKESFENCLTKDGQIAPIGAFNMGGQKVTNLATGISDNDAVNVAQIETRLETLLSTMYPVGSIYIGTQNTCPMGALISGSTWTLVSSGKALWTGNGTTGSGTTSTANFANAPANTTIDAGLPDHKHTVSKRYGTSDISGNTGVDGTTDYEGTMNFTCGKASADNAIYGNSTTVQPPAYVVNVWKRTA